MTGSNLVSIASDGDLKTIYYEQGKDQKEVTSEEVLFATGRTPNIKDLHLGIANVMVRQGKILVDRRLRTSNEHIYAAGDVIGEPMLETMASRGGVIAAENALKGAVSLFDTIDIPTAIFTTPTVATVGYTEERAIMAGVDCMSRAIPITNIPKTRLTGEHRGLIKILAERKSHKIRGVHIMASEAADIIHEGALAIKKELTLEDLIEMVHVYPTISEGIKLSAQAFFDPNIKLCESA